VRNDSGVYEGYTVPRFYDTLLAKLIVWDADRAAAIDRMARALAEYRIVGVRTTIPVLDRIVAHGDFRAGRLDTSFLERLMPELQASPERHAAMALIAAVLTQYEQLGRGDLAAPSSEGPSPWRWGRRGWRGRP
jgi:acetyl/propionyl-CoA carboxylase alpha subunit